jgi:hypothetical protein
MRHIALFYDTPAGPNPACLLSCDKVLVSHAMHGGNKLIGDDPNTGSRLWKITFRGGKR